MNSRTQCTAVSATQASPSVKATSRLAVPYLPNSVKAASVFAAEFVERNADLGLTAAQVRAIRLYTMNVIYGELNAALRDEERDPLKPYFPYLKLTLPGLERMLKQSGQTVPSQKRILELNPEHAVLGKLKTIFDENAEDARLADYAHLLHGQALIAEGTALPDPAGFAKRVTELMVQ